MQRLRRIHQLAGAYLVYPGGVHTRFEHVLGTMHVAGLIAESLTNKIRLQADTIQEIRLAALLHDVGHGPFSHLFEEVLEKTDMTHEDISQRIVRETIVKDIIEKNGFSNISGLTKDDNGVWRGKAMKNGQQVDVSLDYQGNVVTR